MPKEIMKVNSKGYIQYCKQFKLQLDWKSLAEAGDADKEVLCKEISHLLDDINELHKTIDNLRKDMDENYSKKRKRKNNDIYDKDKSMARGNATWTHKGLPKKKGFEKQ